MTEEYQDFDFTAFQRQVVDEFRANGGKVGGMFEGSVLVLLTTVGARSGRPRTSPLACLDIDGLPVVVASAMGADKHPDWYHNIRRNPAVTVETGTQTYPAIAAIPSGEERDRLFARVVEMDPGFADYQTKTTRVIPVLVLHRVEPPSDAAWTRGMGDFLVESHDWLRTELADLRRQVDGLTGGGALTRPAPDLGSQLRAHCVEFCAALQQHHTGEDMGAFPMLAERFPALAPVLATLGEEHKVVSRLREEIEQLVDDYEPGRTDPALLRAELDRLTAELEAHFRYEEQAVVTALNSMGPAPDIG